MNKITIIILMLCSFTQTYAQDMSLELSPQQPQRKSAAQAMLMSAVLPGTGQLYLGQTTKAGIFLAADLLAIGSYIRFNKDMNDAINKYKTYAEVNGGLRRGAGDDIYRLAQYYRSSEEYNQKIELEARNWYWYYNYDPEKYQEYIDRYSIPEEDSWNWEFDYQYKKYYQIRQDKQEYELFSNFALGAILLNRIISVVDAVIFTNKINKTNKLYSLPDSDGRGLRLIYEYKF